MKSFAVAALLVLLVPAFTHAQNPSQTGEIILEEERKSAGYRDSESAAIQYFQDFTASIDKAKSGEAVAPPSIPEPVLFHLTGVYLYCAVNSGTCPLVLDAVLEVDVMSSKLSGSAACPNMKRFWNIWVRNAMEDRHKYLVRTSFINEHSAFNSKRRPVYLKCDATVESEMRGSANPAAYFRERYRAGSPQADFASRLLDLLRQLQSKGINVFLATGAQSGQPAAKTESTKKGFGSSKAERRKTRK